MSGARSRQRPGSCPRWRRPGRPGEARLLLDRGGQVRREQLLRRVEREDVRRALRRVPCASSRRRAPIRGSPGTSRGRSRPAGRSSVVVERSRRGEEEDAGGERPGVERGSEHVLRDPDRGGTEDERQARPSRALRTGAAGSASTSRRRATDEPSDADHAEVEEAFRRSCRRETPPPKTAAGCPRTAPMYSVRRQLAYADPTEPSALVHARSSSDDRVGPRTRRGDRGRARARTTVVTTPSRRPAARAAEASARRSRSRR